jgi:hypothetical protein
LSVAYLDAGAELIRQALDHDLSSKASDRVLPWISVAKLTKEVNRRIVARELSDDLDPNLGKFRDRWDLRAEYIRDLMAWVQRRNQRRDFPQEVAAALAAAGNAPHPVSKWIREVGKANLESLFTNAHFRVQLFLINFGATDQNRDLLPDFYAHVDENWLPTITDVLKHNHLSLRPGIDEQDMLDILTAIAEGLTLRELTDPSKGEKKARRTALQATAALALLVACTSDDNVSLEDAADELIKAHENGPAAA